MGKDDFNKNTDRRQQQRRNGYRLQYGLAALAIVAAIIVFRSCGTIVPGGQYRSLSSTDEMMVIKDTIRLRNGKSTWATLPNKASGRKLFDANDLAKAHPQRLKILKDGRVEYIRDASPPFPEQRIIFERVER